MEMRWRDHGEAMEIRWRDHGETRERERPWRDHGVPRFVPFDPQPWQPGFRIFKSSGDHPKRSQDLAGQPQAWAGRQWTLPGRPRTLPGRLRTVSEIQGPRATGIRQAKTDQNHQKSRNCTHMARYELRIRLFEAHSHFLSIATPPRPQIPWENQHFSENPKIPKSGIPPGVGGNGRSP